MYGFVNYALEMLVLTKFGKEVWEEIKREAEMKMDGHFMQRLIYEDSITYDLVGSCSKVLDIPPENVLELFGAHFFQFCRDEGYDKILEVLGSTTKDFLENLDALHDHLATIYPGMRAPSFRCTDRDDGSTILHYYSHRPGLDCIVMGIVKTVALNLHNTEVNVEVFRTKEETGDHVQFLITNKSPSPMTDAKIHLEQKFQNLFSKDIKIGAVTFCQAFPFHIIFDINLSIVQTGEAISRDIPLLLEQNTTMTKVFEMMRPRMEFSFSEIVAHINTVYVLSTLKNVRSQIGTLRLKGQMIFLAETNCILYQCSPQINSLGDLRSRGLYVSDIPLCDATREVVLLSENYEAEYKLTQNLEILTDQLQQSYSELEIEKQKTDRLMYSILPSSVANELRHGRSVPPHKYEHVTVMFAGIVGFESLCAHYSDEDGAMKIVKLLNDLFSKLDDILDSQLYANIFKVETVSDTYMAVSGIPKANNFHARDICRLSLDMIEACHEIIDPDGKQAELTVGINSGEVVTGVMGLRVPRYCLFGTTVNLASRTKTTGIYGQVNVSQYTFRYVQESGCENDEFDFHYRGPVSMKGRSEPMLVWLLSRGSEKAKLEHNKQRDSLDALSLMSNLETNSKCPFSSLLSIKRYGSSNSMVEQTKCSISNGNKSTALNKISHDVEVEVKSCDVVNSTANHGCGGSITCLI